MKNIIFTLVFFLGAATLLSGQIRFNPKIGININSISQNNFEIGTSSPQVGWQVGADVRFGDRIYFQPGLHYIHYRNKFNIDQSITQPVEENFEETLSSKGLYLPVLVGFDFLKQDALSLNVNAGPSMSILFRNDGPALEGQDLTFQNLLFGLGVGVGVDLRFLTLGIRYERGLTNVYTVEGVKGKNNLLMVSAGILF